MGRPSAFVTELQLVTRRTDAGTDPRHAGRVLTSEETAIVNARTADRPSFLRPLWRLDSAHAWSLSLFVLAVLAATRYYAVLGPPQARILFLVHCLAMWALPFILLAPQGRCQIGLRKPNHVASAIETAVTHPTTSYTLLFLCVCKPLYQEARDLGQR